MTVSFYRAKRSIVRYCHDKLSVCPSVCNFGGLCSHALEFLETNFMADWPNLSSLCSIQQRI